MAKAKVEGRLKTPQEYTPADWADLTFIEFVEVTMGEVMNHKPVTAEGLTSGAQRLASMTVHIQNDDGTVREHAAGFVVFGDTEHVQGLLSSFINALSAEMQQRQIYALAEQIANQKIEAMMTSNASLFAVPSSSATAEEETPPSTSRLN